MPAVEAQGYPQLVGTQILYFGQNAGEELVTRPLRPSLMNPMVDLFGGEQQPTDNRQRTVDG